MFVPSLALVAALAAVPPAAAKRFRSLPCPKYCSRWAGIGGELVT